jgi:class 3 adenylate cyclase
MCAIFTALESSGVYAESRVSESRQAMPHLQRKMLDKPDEVRPHLALGRTEIYQLDDIVVGRMVMEPGWRWSVDVQPTVGTERCPYHHLGVTVSGRLQVELADGSELEIGPDMVYEIPPGHDAWVIGDDPWVALDFAGARAYARPVAGTGERILVTLLFTDIVESTAMLEKIGDAAWRDLLGRHLERMQTELDRYRGRQIDTTGDGLLAVFDGSARAVSCAQAMITASRELGLAIRAGLHTGEVEVVPGTVRGLAVHIAARIMSLAGADEVLVSGTTYELLAGSGLEFESRGRHVLKGIAGDREVFALKDAGD